MKKIYAIIAFCLLITYTPFSQTISSNAPLCGDANLTLELTATGGTTYAWKGPNNFTSTQQKPSIKNVNWKNRGVYTVMIDNKTTLTTDVNIKDPVAFTVPKEISVCEGGSFIIEPKRSKLTDSTENDAQYGFVPPSGKEVFDYYFKIKNFTAKDAGTYKVNGYSYLGCSTTQEVKVTLNTNKNCKSIEVEDLSKVKMCYGQEVIVPFITKGDFKVGTKFKAYIIRLNSSSNSFDNPIAIVEKSPFVIKNLDKYFDQTIAIVIVADDAEKTTAISNYKYFYNHRFSMNSVQSCDSSNLSVNNYNFKIDGLQWFFNSNPINGATNNRFTAKTTGTYSFKYSGNATSNEIDKTCLYESQPVKIELGKIEKPFVSVNNDIELCVGKPATLSVSSNANTNYRWKKDGNYIANATNSTYQTLQEGKYQIEAKEGNCIAVSDTVVLKKTLKSYFDLSNVFTQNIDNTYTLCNNQEFILIGNVTVGGLQTVPESYLSESLTYGLFKNGDLIREKLPPTEKNYGQRFALKESGTFQLKTVYGNCESVSKPITIKYSNSLKGETFLQNNTIDICEGNTTRFKISFNGEYNKLGNGFLYKDGKIIQDWEIESSGGLSYYFSIPEVKESGNYYAVGKIILPNKSECSVITDTIKVNFSRKVQGKQTINLSSCRDTVDLVTYNENFGSYGREISKKWTKDGVVLKQDSLNIFQATQEGIYQLETKYKEGCTVISSPFKVEFGKITIDWEYYDKPSICEGESYNLYPYLTENSDKSVYNFTKDGKTISTRLQDFYILTQSGTYKLKVTNGKCEGTSPDFTLKVDKIPTTITPSDSVTFCDGKTVELKTSTEAGLSYIWERNGSVTTQANQANYTANADGLYKATLLRGACWGTTPSVKLKTLANIIPTATLTGDKKINLDEETKLSINLTSHAPWTFKLSDGKEYTATKSPFEVSVKPLSTTTYSLSEIKNICGTGTVSGTAKIEIIILSAEEEKELNVEVFPVPSSEICHWKIETPQATNSSVVLYDVLGVTQYSQTSSTRTQIHEGTIDLTNMKSGTYFLELQAGEKSVVRKVVKY